MFNIIINIVRKWYKCIFKSIFKQDLKTYDQADAILYFTRRGQTFIVDCLNGILFLQAYIEIIAEKYVFSVGASFSCVSCSLPMHFNENRWFPLPGVEFKKKKNS